MQVIVVRGHGVVASGAASRVFQTLVAIASSPHILRFTSGVVAARFHSDALIRS